MNIEEFENNIRKDFSTVQNDMGNLKKDIDNINGIVKGMAREFEIVKRNMNNIVDFIQRSQEEPPQGEDLGEDFEEVQEPPKGEKSNKAPQVEPDHLEETDEDILLEEGPSQEGEDEASEEDLSEEELDVPPEKPKMKKAGRKRPASSFYKSIKERRG